MVKLKFGIFALNIECISFYFHWQHGFLVKDKSSEARVSGCLQVFRRERGDCTTPMIHANWAVTFPCSNIAKELFVEVAEERDSNHILVTLHESSKTFGPLAEAVRSTRRVMSYQDRHLSIFLHFSESFLEPFQLISRITHLGQQE